MKPNGVVELLYGLALRCLPPSIRREDEEAIRSTFHDQLQDAGAHRLGVAWRAFRRLPGLIAREWLDEVRGPAKLNRPGGAQNQRMGGERMGSMFRTVRHALRGLRKAPVFSGGAGLLIALGVGASTAVFAIVDGVVLRPLPYPAAERLTYLTNGSHNGPLLERLPGVDAFEAWTATATTAVNLARDDGEPVRLTRTETTPSFFSMFGGRPHLGRLLTESDRNDVSIGVLSHRSWLEVFGGDSTIVGSTIRIDGAPIEVVGVLSEDFQPPERAVSRDVALFRPIDWNNPNFESPGFHAHQVLGRLAPGVGIDVADTQIARIATQIADAYPEYYTDGPESWPLAELHAETVGDVRQGLLVLLGAVGLLLLVACVNVAHLFMSRGLTRSREMSIRRAMGAGSANLIGQLATESLLVGLIGGGAGLLLAWGALQLFGGLTAELPRANTVTLDLRVAAFAVGVSIGTALLFGLLPALRALGRDVQEGLRGGGRGITGSRRTRLVRNGLVTAEVALSLVLVAGAGLLMRSFLQVNAQDPGVDPRGVWMIPLNVPGVDEAEAFVQRMDALLASVQAVPGVELAAYGFEMPFQYVGGSGCCWGSTVFPEGRRDEEGAGIQVRVHPYSIDALETVGTPLVAGRMWSEAEANGGGDYPVVISEELAIRVFGSAADAIGGRLEFFSGARVTGVAAPTLHMGLDQPHEMAMYTPVERLSFGIPIATIAARAPRAGDGFERELRRAIWSVEPDLPVPAVRTLDEMIESSSDVRRMGGLLVSAFGAVALLLAAAGLYGTLLYAVGQRRRELGIRMALGAGSSAIRGRVVREGLTLALVGVLLGVGVTWWGTRFLEGFLFGVSPTDPVALIGASGVLLTAAAAATWIPAWRAGRTDPLQTLKAE